MVAVVSERFQIRSDVTFADDRFGSVAAVSGDCNTALVSVPSGNTDPNPANNYATDISAVPNGACIFIPLSLK